MNINIFVVLVTYNRIDKLKKALASYDSQTCLPSDILVVDNKSTDETPQFLDEWKNDSRLGIRKHVLTMDRNLGGAGGFRAGIQYALEQEVAEWLWVADDDAYPENNCLQIVAENVINDKYGNVACYCGTVCDKVIDCIDIEHRRYNTRGLVRMPKRVQEEEYKKDHVFIEETSYVGSCYKVEALKKAGLPNDRMFIYFDDTEHSHRIVQQGKIVLLPSMKIVHDTGALTKSSDDVVATWRDYYLIRNHIYTLKKYHWLTYIAYLIQKYYKIRKLYSMHKNKNVYEMHLQAMKDGMNERLGIHEIYKPGFEIKK